LTERAKKEFSVETASTRVHSAFHPHRISDGFHQIKTSSPEIRFFSRNTFFSVNVQQS